jgi:hypothetical protein
VGSEPASGACSTWNTPERGEWLGLGGRAGLCLHRSTWTIFFGVTSVRQGSTWNVCWCGIVTIGMGQIGVPPGTPLPLDCPLAYQKHTFKAARQPEGLGPGKRLSGD